jgi:hypothetical protein
VKCRPPIYCMRFAGDRVPWHARDPMGALERQRPDQGGARQPGHRRTPMVNSAKEAEEAVAAAKYPPRGRRFAPWRASNYYARRRPWPRPTTRSSSDRNQGGARRRTRSPPSPASMRLCRTGRPRHVARPADRPARRRLARPTKVGGLRRSRIAGIDVASLDYCPSFASSATAC